MAVFAASTTPNKASCGGPTTTTTTSREPKMALNLVKRLARKIWPTVRPGAGGNVLTRPAETLSATSSVLSPVAAMSPVLRGSSGPVGVVSAAGNCRSTRPFFDLVPPFGQSQKAWAWFSNIGIPLRRLTWGETASPTNQELPKSWHTPGHMKLTGTHRDLWL